MKNYNKAIEIFDSNMIEYKQFTEAKFYKSICLNDLGLKDAAKTLLEDSLKDFQEGFSINESNVAYEEYPYQLKEFNFEVAKRLFQKN